MSLHVAKAYGKSSLKIGWHLRLETRSDDVALKADILALVETQYPKDFAAFKKAAALTPDIWSWEERSGYRWLTISK